MKLGDRIKERRLKLGLTQRQLGELVHMDPSLISHHEHGDRTLTTEQLERFTKALQTSEVWLLRGEGPADASEKEALELNDVRSLRESNAKLSGQLEESKGTIMFLKDLLRDLFPGSRREGSG